MRTLATACGPQTFTGRRSPKSLRFAVPAFLLLVLGASRPAAPATDPAGDLVKLKAAHVADETFAWHKGFERFRDAVRVRSGNTIEVQIFPNGQLGTEKD